MLADYPEKISCRRQQTKIATQEGDHANKTSLTNLSFVALATEVQPQTKQLGHVDAACSVTPNSIPGFVSKNGLIGC